jgi:hypothetical protein
MDKQNITRQGEDGAASAEAASAVAARQDAPKVIPSPIDFTKPVRTKAGYPVRILAIDMSLKKPVVGVIDNPAFGWGADAWSLGGAFGGTSGCLDLENVEPANPEFDAWFARVAETIELDPETSTLTIARLAWDAARRTA